MLSSMLAYQGVRTQVPLIRRYDERRNIFTDLVSNNTYPFRITLILINHHTPISSNKISSKNSIKNLDRQKELVLASSTLLATIVPEI